MTDPNVKACCVDFFGKLSQSRKYEMLEAKDRVFTELSRFKRSYEPASTTERSYYAGKFTGFLNACLVFEQISRDEYERIYAFFESYIAEK